MAWEWAAVLLAPDLQVSHSYHMCTCFAISHLVLKSAADDVLRITWDVDNVKKVYGYLGVVCSSLGPVKLGLSHEILQARGVTLADTGRRTALWETVAIPLLRSCNWISRPAAS